jgi:cytochrome c553
MKRTMSRRLWVSSLVAVGAAASAAACSSADPPVPVDSNPVIVTSQHPPPISGGTLLIQNNLAIAADSDRDMVWVVDLTSQQVSSIALQKGDEPGRLVADAAGRIHVGLRGAGAVATLDLATQQIVGRTAVCSAPRGLAYDSATDLVHVACAGGELVSLPAAGGAAVRSLVIADRDLRDVVVQGSNLLVTRMRTPEVLEIDSSGALINRQSAPGVTDPGALGATFTPTVAWRAIPNAPGVGGLLMVHQLSADSQIVISQPGGYGNGGGGGNGCDGTIVHTTVAVFDSNGNAPTSVAPFINGASVPVDLAYDGNQFAIASAGADALFFLQGSGGTQPPDNGIGCTDAAMVSLPGQPVAVATGPAGFVAQIRELASPQQGPALVISDGTTVTATIPLNGVTRADTGHSLFHHNASGSSPLACASCHPEGHEDGHTWVFDTEGQRRTQTVSGGVLATAPLHWDGSMTDLPDIMHEVFQVRMGGAAQGPQHVEAFGLWLNSIPAYPASAPGTAAQIEHGQQLFESPAVGCATCHSGAHFTNNQTVSVGTQDGDTITAFQVPTLIGVAARRPYMHDGCAATLQDRFDPAQSACNGGDQHGHVSQLSQTDVADLISYLETL